MNARDVSGSVLPSVGERPVAEDDGPTAGGIAGAVAFWVVAIGIALLTTSLFNQPAWVWAVRVITMVAGVGVAIFLIVREKARAGQGLPPDRDSSAFDLWTIAHTIAGLVMGAWALPGLLVLVYTIAWEVFEFEVPGFGDKEIMLNRVVDVAVACVGWLVVAGFIALATGQQMPWLLPTQDSLLRAAGLRLF